MPSRYPEMTPHVSSTPSGARGFLRTRGIALACALIATLAVLPSAWGAGLGRLNVRSALGQAFDAEVDVPVLDRDEIPSLKVNLGSQAAFKQAGLDFNAALTTLRFDLQQRPDGSNFVHITSTQPVNEPYLDLLLELTWSNGRVVREYTVLLDPPAFKQAPEIVPPAEAAAEGCGEGGEAAGGTISGACLNAGGSRRTVYSRTTRPLDQVSSSRRSR